MSTVKDKGVIDLLLVEDEKLVLVIIDDMEWKFATRRQHGGLLQDKINDYLRFIASGQAAETHPGLRPVIRIEGEYSYSKYCIEFLERVRAFIKGKE